MEYMIILFNDDMICVMAYNDNNKISLLNNSHLKYFTSIVIFIITFKKQFTYELRQTLPVMYSINSIYKY